MTIQELFAKHGVESADLITAVEGYISEITKDKDNMIPYDRFKEVIKQKNELQAKIAEFETQIVDK